METFKEWHSCTPNHHYLNEAEKAWSHQQEKIEKLEKELAVKQLALDMARDGLDSELAASEEREGKLRACIEGILPPLEMYKAYGWGDRDGVVREAREILKEIERE